MPPFPDAETTRDSELSADFWEQRYQDGTAPWDLGQPAPPLVHLLSLATAPLPGPTVVLGCGRGYEALLFARHGFEVIGVDYAPSAIAAATEMAVAEGLPARFIERDIFKLLPDYQQQFDYVIEHTCFCALDPGWRHAYVDLVHALLKPQGNLIGLFFTHPRPGGPPYGATPEDITRHFQQRFHIQSLEPTPHSVAARQQEEHLGIFQRL